MPVDFARLESKWQSAWASAKLFEADPDPNVRKCFVNFPFPYMNGPLHVGHGFTATRLDVYARFKRMQGYRTLFPWAWHWTGEPIVGAALRVKKGDEKELQMLREIDRVPLNELEKFIDPIYMAEYYTEQGRETLKRMGFSIDWRREFHTTSLEPTFSRFVEWQYITLRELGYVARGTHPVVWCPHDESPTGDHDRLEGEGVSPEEYTLIKFRLGDAVLPAATFRPETIFGVTNMFVNPDAGYVEAQVDGEKWIISAPAAEKLREQNRAVQVARGFQGSELVGRMFQEPLYGRSMPILPGWFVDPESATGVVYSVPSHAPADWIALKDLREHPERLHAFGLDPSILDAVKPISMISVDGFGEHPAIELVERMGIRDQLDPKVEEATALLYRKEFHGGVLKPVCGAYAGSRVAEVKSALIADFRKLGIADSMFDLPQRVVCRCTTRCIVKILRDQWFLRYSDPEWKRLAHKAIDQARIYPEGARVYFHDRIDWLKDWACARRTGLGTPLPWDPTWIVETLSDSTVYMMFYTINVQIKGHGIRPEQLTREVFDYVFLGKGDLSKVSGICGLTPDVLEAMRREFLYWYPVDLRNSGKDLVPNHLSFFIFQHVALLPEELWPKGIGVNGSLAVEGAKMSKSKGNFVALRQAIEDFGADATRLALVLGAEGMDDPNWRAQDAKQVRSSLDAFYHLVQELSTQPDSRPDDQLDLWLLSVLQERVREVTQALEELKTRTAAERAFFEVWNDFRWYARRSKQAGKSPPKEALSIWLRLMAPFTPHLCEELWPLIGGEGFISVAEWPRYDAARVSSAAVAGEELLRGLMEDTASILKATGIRPRRICYYCAAAWKRRIYVAAAEIAKSGGDLSSLMKRIMQDTAIRAKAKAAAKVAETALTDARKLSAEERESWTAATTIDEVEVLRRASSFLADEFKAEVVVYDEEEEGRYDPAGKASQAKPRRPAIFIE
ncbi:MAG: leucine--tRNA ligase [Candidatus Bathyarchaeia archaeon]